MAVSNTIREAVEVFRRAFEPTLATEVVSVPSFTGGADAFATLSLAEARPAVLAVTPGIPEAERLAEDLRLLAGQEAVYFFPPPLEDDPGTLGLRLKALEALQNGVRPLAIVAPSASLLAGVPASVEPAAVLRLDAPASVSFSALCERLHAAGYQRTPAVEREGFYSVRGGIVDVWGPGEESPVRAEFFGEELDALRFFDPATQVSIRRAECVTLMPCAAADAAAPGAGETSIFSLLPDGAAVLALEHGEYSPSIPAGPRLFTVYSGAPVPPDAAESPFRTAPLPGFSELRGSDAHHPELFELARATLARHLAAAQERGSLVLRLDDLSAGFEIPGLVVVSKADRVFAKRRISRSSRPAAPSGTRISDFSELEPGEYVVHSGHGVGKFLGSSQIMLDGHMREVFTIEYDGGALLHVPAEHAHLITRYVGVRGEAVHLHRLDGQKWEHDKAKARKAVADLAASLLETQARRETVPGFAYDIDCDGLAAFEAAFPYEETPDQAAAIAAVKEDMSKRRPMDRLICGDAGYGKTEVAMRAAYIAAMNGRQVAVLAPTTVLAEQHYETFTSRFDGTPVSIEPASRFQSAAVRQRTFQRLASGVCDIVIGTHAILSPKVAFRDLGLIIIDEEQRFGVRHKEFLKNLRSIADVLTLSATPIPRTLYLSMTGARDLSLLRTPPRERVAVETKVVRDSDDAIRKPIEAELRRGGQVYFLHNRVATIAKVEKRLRSLCPNARITLAHGQMDAESLARKIREFERGKSDILLSTTIVESGIDIPRANTILIDHADCFGLADLYQLRGRVGRSSRQGHAILLLDVSGEMDADARERLRALQRHGGLGAGFGLALRDLELRGAGNLLGSQQSGHIAAVGFTLYCQLLQRTIAALKGEKIKEVVDVSLGLDFIDPSPDSPDVEAAAAIPYSYVEDDMQRMSLLRRFAQAADLKAVKALRDEMRDRFGPLPPAAARFAKIAALRVQAATAGFSRIDARGNRAFFYTPSSREVAFVADIRGSSPDQRLASIQHTIASGLARV